MFLVSLSHQSPIIQPVTSGEMVDDIQREESSSVEEIPNPKNVEDSTVDRNVYETLYYLLLTLPLLRTQA